MGTGDGNQRRSGAGCALLRRRSPRISSDRGEQALGAAYDLGREAVAAQLSVLDLAEAHHSALRAALARGDGTIARRRGLPAREPLDVRDRPPRLPRGPGGRAARARVRRAAAARSRSASVAINSRLTVEAILQLTADTARRSARGAGDGRGARAGPAPAAADATSPPAAGRRRPSPPPAGALTGRGARVRRAAARAGRRLGGDQLLADRRGDPAADGRHRPRGSSAPARATVAILAPGPAAAPADRHLSPAPRAAASRSPARTDGQADGPRQGARGARGRSTRRDREFTPRDEAILTQLAQLASRRDLQRPALRARAHDRPHAAALAAAGRAAAGARALAPPCASAPPARGSSSAATSTTSSRPATAPGRR